MTIGELIKSRRKSAGITQAELGYRIGISGAAIAQWENNLRKPKVDTLRRIAAALSVDWLELVPEDERGNWIAADVIKRGELQLADASETNSALSTLERLEKSGSTWRALTPIEAYQTGFIDGDSEIGKVWWIYDYCMNSSGKELALRFLLNQLNEEQLQRTLDYLEQLIRIPRFQQSSEQKKEPSGEGNP